MTADVRAEGRHALPVLLQDVVVVPSGESDNSDVPATTAKVLDLEPGPSPAVVLSRPAADGRRHPTAMLVWTANGGQFSCPVLLSADHRDYGPVWLARPTGHVRRRQRRGAFRVPLPLPVQLAWSTDRGQGVGAAPAGAASEPAVHEVSATTIDISESGVLVAVRRDPPPVGHPVAITLVIDGATLQHPGTVVRVTAMAAGITGVAVAFDDPARHGDRIRRTALAAQRRALAARRR